MREIAERIADRAYEYPSAEDLRVIRLDLYHDHIPRLEELDVVSYDRDDETVEVRPNFETLIPFLDQMTEEDLSRSNT